jgi:hypothetical protein
VYDLKLIGRSEDELRNEIKIVKTFNNDIKIKFGRNKCARISLKYETVYRKQHIGNTMENEIKELEPMKAYKYLGVEDNHRNTEYKNEKEKLKKEYVRRLRLILNTELSAKNKMQAIGSLAVPVLRYIFGIINWHQEETKTG